MILEACVGNLEDAVSAQQKGAHQIELCDRLDLDGSSPSLEMVEEVSVALDIDIKVIINPKPFDYSYNKDELEEIKNYITSLSKFNVVGVVFGPVDAEGMPDLDAIKAIAECTDLPITYHKAIDNSPDILQAIQVLIEQGIVRYVLTSGGAKTAEEGSNMITRMNDAIQKNKSNIQLIGAGRITKENLSHLDNDLGLNYYHGKLIVGEL